MRALSIRQPFAELILRGTKAIEYRTRPTRIIGERFWIYASKGRGVAAGRDIWSKDLSVPDAPLPPWMIELAEGLRLWKPGDLPTGVIVGSAVISACVRMGQGASGKGQATASADRVSSSLAPPPSPLAPLFEWHLASVERLVEPRKPDRHPQPAWFNPF